METIVAFAIRHVHLKTRDPKGTVQFYVDNFGATLKQEIPGRGYQVDLHGLQLNITTIIAAQKHEQHYGFEHIAVETDDYSGTLARLRTNGVRILEELAPNNGRRVCFLEAPEGAQIELSEKAERRQTDRRTEERRIGERRVGPRRVGPRRTARENA
jgi:catechol 2,3-dioxygenase-like lactoylglutathione lyase family enzyme